MIFDQSAFADTVHAIRRDLELVAQSVAWLAPCAYEQGTASGSGHGATVCRQCRGNSAWRDDKGRPCYECVVATIGDAGEIVVRRGHIADHLNETARQVEHMWKTTGALKDRVSKLAALVDRGVSNLPGMEPISVDPRELPALWRAKERRVASGEDLPGIASITKHAKDTARQAARTQDAIDSASATAAEEGKRKRGWHK